MRAPILGVLLATALTACAGAIAHNLQRESAHAIIPTPYPDSVKVSEIRHTRLGTKTTWVATTPGALYDCSLEGNEHRALCVKRGP